MDGIKLYFINVKNYKGQYGSWYTRILLNEALLNIHVFVVNRLYASVCADF